MKILTSRQAATSSFNQEHFLNAIKSTLEQLQTRLKDEPQTRPVFLILGTSQSGKSTLIEQAELAIKQRITQENKYCQTWLTPSAAYFELPAFLLSNDDQKLWKQLIKLFSSYKDNLLLSGILLTFSMANACYQTNIEQAQQMNQLQLLKKALNLPGLKNLPIYLIYTHLDRIRGFTEFFAELTANERQQAFGFFVADNKSGSYAKIVNKHFLQLSKQLNERLVRHLHQQRQPFQRALIHDFPLQFESLSSVITPLIQQFFDRSPLLNCAGIFFSGTTLLGVTCDRLAHTLTNHVNLPVTPHLSQSATQKTYFSHDLLTKQLPQHSVTKYHATNSSPLGHLQHKISIVALCLLALSSITWFAKEFNHDLNQLRTITEAVKQTQQLLEHSQTESQPEVSSVLFLMSTLNKAGNHLTLNFLPKVINPFNDWQQLQLLSQINYQALLNKFFLPELTNTLKAQMRQGTSTNDALYNALKVYLMLANPTYRQPDFIANWFKHSLIGNFNFNPQQQQQLAEHFKIILQQPNVIIDKDEQLVAETRAKLSSQPKSFLAYSLLKAAQLTTSPSDISDDNPVFSPTRFHFIIPSLYTQQGFKKAYLQDIKQFVTLLAQGDWVLDTHSTNNASSMNVDETTKQVQSLYVADYVNWWNLFIYNTRVLAFRNAEQAKQAFSNLENKNSVFNQLLHLLNTNTQKMEHTADGISDVFNSQIAKRFETIDKMPKEINASFLAIIKEVNKQLVELSASNDDDQAAFDLVKHRFNESLANDPISQLMELAKKSPNPLNLWLEQLANNYWHMLLFKVQHYIDQQWQINVYADYEANIARRYPLAKQSNDTISLANFVQFFSYNGKLDSFVQKYLEPFIDTSQTTWKAKSLYGSSLPLDDKFLQQLIRAKLIRKMFFNQDSQLIAIKFNLKPVSFEPIIKDFVLSINGESVFTYQGSDKVSEFTWPGDSKDESVKLTIDTINNKHYTVEEPGTWALFKFLEKSNLQPMDDTQHYQLLIALNGTAAKFTLESDRLINPFVPNIIQEFELPIKLTKMVEDRKQ